jgi:hypothetical protein
VSEGKQEKTMDEATKRYWKVVGYDSTKKVFEKVMPLGFLSEVEMTVMLQRLVAATFTPDDIIRASLRSSSRYYAPHLEAQTESGPPPKRFSISVGYSRHYVASVWTADELGDGLKGLDDETFWK